MIKSLSSCITHAHLHTIACAMAIPVFVRIREMEMHSVWALKRIEQCLIVGNECEEQMQIDTK